MKYAAVEQSGEKILIPLAELESMSALNGECAAQILSGSMPRFVTLGRSARKLLSLDQLLDLPSVSLKRGSRILNLTEVASSVLVELVSGVVELEKLTPGSEIVLHNSVYHVLSLNQLASEFNSSQAAHVVGENNAR